MVSDIAFFQKFIVYDIPVDGYIEQSDLKVVSYLNIVYLFPFQSNLFFPIVAVSMYFPPLLREKFNISLKQLQAL